MNNIEKLSIIIKNVCERIEPGKKMLQKLLYLMERRGVQLELNYSIHYFGPYSSKLDNAMHSLESKDIINIDTNGLTHKISIGDTAKGFDNLLPEDLEKVEFVLDNFLGKSALELEALTTIDYVAISLLKNQAKDEDIISGVKKIKGSKFSDEYLAKELQLLKKCNYLN